MAIGDEASEQMHEEIVGTAVTRMLDLADVLELVDDGLNEGAFAQEHVSGEGQEDVAHILAEFRDELQAVAKEELLGERRRDIALVPKEFAKEPTDQAGNGLAVVRVARGEAKCEQLPAVIDH